MAKKKTTKKKAAEKSTKKVAKKASSKKVQKKTASSPSKKTAKKVQKKTVAKKSPAKKVAKKATKKVAAKKVAKKVTKKVAKKVVKKEVKKTTKKVSPQTTKTKATPVKSEPSEIKGKKSLQVKSEDNVAVKPGKISKPSQSEEKAIPKTKEKVDKALAAKQPSNKKISKKEKEALSEEIMNLTEEFSFDEVVEAISQIDFFKSQTDECIVKNCDNPVTTGPYCRLCYIKFWDLIKKKETIIAENKLQFLIEDIIKKYPIRYIEEILKDLSDEKSFFSVLKEMNIDVVDEAYDEAEGNVEDEQDLSFETKSVGRSFSSK